MAAGKGVELIERVKVLIVIDARTPQLGVLGPPPHMHAGCTNPEQFGDLVCAISP